MVQFYHAWRGESSTKKKAPGTKNAPASYADVAGFLATVREMALPTMLAIKADIHVTNPAPRLYAKNSGPRLA